MINEKINTYSAQLKTMNMSRSSPTQHNQKNNQKKLTASGFEDFSKSN